MSNVFKDITSEAMSTVWHRTPREFQSNVISHILEMRCEPNTPQATLLVQGTGGGKSAVYQAIGIVDAGVTLVIETTLSLPGI